MKLIQERLQYGQGWARPDVFILPTHRSVTADGRLVMHQGHGLELKGAYPGIDEKLGQKIKALPPHSRLAVCSIQPAQLLIWYQDRHSFKDDPSLAMIGLATIQLNNLIRTGENSEITFHMAFPEGGRHQSEVQLFLQELPDNVLIYKE